MNLFSQRYVENRHFNILKYEVALIFFLIYHSSPFKKIKRKQK